MAEESITRLLAAWRGGDRDAVKDLMPLVYDELRSLAKRQLGGGAGETLRTTDLVHEAYLKLSRHTRLAVEDRHHFFAIAAKAMRQLVVDHARRRVAAKRGGPLRPLSLADVEPPLHQRAAEIVALDDALERLAGLDAWLCEIVELRFFGGLSVEETAVALDCSARTVERDWRKARAFLYRELTEQ